MKTIFIVDADEQDLNTARALLSGRYNVSCYRNVVAAYRDARVGRPEFVLLDMSGDSLAELSDPIGAFMEPPCCCGIVCIGLSPSIALIVSSMRRGASDFIQKPCNLTDLLRSFGIAAVDRCGRLERPALDCKPMCADCPGTVETATVDRNGPLKALIGDSPPMIKVRQRIVLFARYDAPVLILGESGTGKELAAAAIHAGSSRSDKKYLPVDCASIPEQLAESRLFGTVKGAFTDARDRIGVFEAASGGSVFLDEIGELHIAVQAKLLRFLETRQAPRLGEHDGQFYDLRIISASDALLYDRPERFRQELFHRISTLYIRMPPLRERLSDIAMIADGFLEAETTGMVLHPEALDKLMSWHWPGNIRELKNTLCRARVYADTRKVIVPDDIEIIHTDHCEGKHGQLC
jgi:two-component system repressor protein LuxO